MGKKKVGIIFGGKSAEHEVSLQSAKNIVDAINKELFDVVLVGIDKKGEWHINDASSYLLNEENPKLIELNKSNDAVAVVPGKGNGQLVKAGDATPLEQLDVIFPIVHGTLGEDGSLQGMLRMANLPYVGPNVLSSAVCMDKGIAKVVLQEAGVEVAKGFSFNRAKKDTISFEKIEEALGTPVFIKPANQGSSVGVTKATTKEEFIAGVEEAFQYDYKIIIEEMINGREIECAVLGNATPKASELGEILPQNDFYSYESKYIDEKGAELSIPAKLEEEKAAEIKTTAIQAFQALQCEGLARVDFFLTPEGKIIVNEVNTLPGFTKISMYPKLWEISGLEYTDLITTLIDLAMERYEEDQQLKSTVW
ncbi:D-alanine--D-alanine ligase A [Oceanobacillus picturae]|uniref:D-alanine--D-alanine ligase n=1 Tax=Oceanobacillus picturae TaxID=171693 RepID=W9AMX0_9BACI|nr:D-alanine--D-alanine ligase [Oceanobacillus picturae]CDO03996.1 D-alanine--D-alanine ligase A [Oceanobacillus picturae]